MLGVHRRVSISNGSRKFCFYCDCTFQEPSKKARRNGRLSRLSGTVDHVFPQCMIPMAPRTGYWLHINQVWSCFSCNNKKGSLHPLAWLPVVKSDAGADRLARLLIRLGVENDVVQNAMTKREAVEPAI